MKPVHDVILSLVAALIIRLSGPGFFAERLVAAKQTGRFFEVLSIYEMIPTVNTFMVQSLPVGNFLLEMALII